MKPVRFLNEKQKEFQKLMETLCYSRQSWQVWSDFVIMSAISISNALDQAGETHDKRERRYMEIINGYSEAERALFPKMLAIVVVSLEENPRQDFLGEMFMALNLGNHYRGQFFTPYSLCECMAKMEISEKSKMEISKPFVTVFDCACGAGALLIAARNALGDCKTDWSTEALFVAQDIDELAGLMCYIQLSLLGCAGYVVIADSLCHPAAGYNGDPLLPVTSEYQSIWYTPLLYHEAWQSRRTAAYLSYVVRDMPELPHISEPVESAEPHSDGALSELCEVASEEEQIAPLSVSESGQLSLF